MEKVNSPWTQVRSHLRMKAPSTVKPNGFPKALAKAKNDYTKASIKRKKQIIAASLKKA